MSDKRQLIILAMTAAAAISIGISVAFWRVQDCRLLGHGLPYCIAVWGLR